MAPQLAGSLFALVVSIVVVLIVWAVRGGAGGKQTQGTVARPGGPTCQCGMVAQWMLPTGPWHCDRCNVPVAMGAQGPPCETCGGSARWIAVSNAWGCDRCRKLIRSATRLA